jgi:hypothetical protein
MDNPSGPLVTGFAYSQHQVELRRQLPSCFPRQQGELFLVLSSICDAKYAPSHTEQAPDRGIAQIVAFGMRESWPSPRAGPRPSAA